MTLMHASPSVPDASHLVALAKNNFSD